MVFDCYSSCREGNLRIHPSFWECHRGTRLPGKYKRPLFPFKSFGDSCSFLKNFIVILFDIALNLHIFQVFYLYSLITSLYMECLSIARCLFCVFKQCIILLNRSHTSLIKYISQYLILLNIITNEIVLGRFWWGLGFVVFTPKSSQCFFWLC